MDNNSKTYVLSQIKELRMSGAESILLACTELALLFSNVELKELNLIDTAEVHACYAASVAYSGELAKTNCLKVG